MAETLGDMLEDAASLQRDYLAQARKIVDRAGLWKQTGWNITVQSLFTQLAYDADRSDPKSRFIHVVIDVDGFWVRDSDSREPTQYGPDDMDQVVERLKMFFEGA